MNSKKLYIINGLRRSGNHAICNWISAHHNSVSFINDCNNFRLNSNWLPSHDKYSIKKNIDENPDTIIVGFENKLDKNQALLNLSKQYFDIITKLYKCDIQQYNIILIRNFFNVLASSVKSWPGSYWFDDLQNFWNGYVQYALKQVKNNNGIMLIYDLWLNKELRNKYATTLGFDNMEIGLKAIPYYGGGSSFDTDTVDYDKLKNRWKQMLDHNEFIRVARQFKHWDTYVTIFGKDDIYNFFTNH